MAPTCSVPLSRGARRAGACGALLATLLAAGAAEARCTRTGYRFGPGIPTAAATWVVQAGTPCATALSPGGRLVLNSVTVETQAANGVAGVGSRYQFAYNPRPGFTGRDSFVVKIDFESGGRRDVSRVRIDVDVRNRL